jgi:hypothetical protein
MGKSKFASLGALLVILCACGTSDPTSYSTWHCVETSPMSSRNYLVDIYKTKKDTTIYLISNFHKISVEGEYDVKIKLTGKKYSFNPVPQQVGNSQYIIRSGGGVANATSTQIDFDYVIYDGISDMAVHATYTR